ncbi:mitochondrial ribosomal protein S18A [Lasioglossum baleicum]|uniref:mitochondrial ribosomal protein S18A n=1 Tax=Lasioglossum baleicum TaxID=434251 RepID=UPI003FCED70E
MSAALFRFVKNAGRSIQLPTQNRNISLSGTSYLKEIIEKKEGNNLIIEAVIKPDVNDSRFLKPKKGVCPVCSSGLSIRHTDVLILSQFITSNGNILPRRITGLCKVQQQRISSMILMAQRAGIMPKKSPSGEYWDHLNRGKWKTFNTYYDEDTIRAKYRL